ncbi:S8 family serine peptidase [Christiangramia sp. SM2212]|uniref:S8 family serine peptidase n=1 Tax=Christiangramia sediminicola TaxID=3073267 RepID=A0ABU1EQU5_9FLAO|nr:S8 family serine peptidase [Christiangramia sp. SM2212]MDR5590760.1 S8 family serine peptidase [Christiangramia sp. SM2212]
MKRLLFLFLFITCISYSQEEHAWVYFKDKANVEAALDNPSSILSQKAIQRKQLRNTPIDERDVPVNEEYISTIKSQDGITVKAKSKWLNCVHVLGSAENISKLETLDFVSAIEFAGEHNNDRSMLEQKQSRNKLENLVDYEYGLASNQTLMLNTNYLHENDLTGQGITVAVIDAGFPNVNSLAAFSQLRSDGRLLGGYDFPNRSSDFSNPALSNHGTLVLSTMTAYIDGKYVGTAPKSSYYLFRTEIAPTETPVEETYWVEAAERADSLGVDVINTSLGYTLFDDSKYSYAPEDMDGETAFISRGANIATEKGLLVVVSAGNRGDESYFKNIGAPSDANVLSIGAVDKNRNYAFFSSIGPSADGRIKPDLAAQGLDIISIDQFDNLVQGSGTSFASPILAGSIASFWQADPSLTNLEVMDLLKASASQFENPDFKLGYGIPNFKKALDALTDLEEDVDEEKLNIDELLIYQNPVYNLLRFNNPTQGTYDITLFDTIGQIVLQKKNVQEEIDLSGFSRGIYIAMFEQNNTRESFLIIKK